MKHINLTQMLQGCSKRNGMTVSASMHDGGQSRDGNRQLRVMSQSGCSAVDVPMTSYGASDEHPMRIRSASNNHPINLPAIRYAAMVVLLLCLGVGQMWAVDPPTATFTVTPTLSSGSTYEITSLDIKGTGNCTWVEVPSTTSYGYITFGYTSGNSRNYYIYGTNGTVKDASRYVVMYNGYYSPEVLFTPSDILTSGGKYYLVFKADAGVDFKATKVRFTLFTPSSVSTSNFYQTYAATPKTVAQLITAASLPSYLSINGVSGVSSDKTHSSSVSTVTTPHDFTAISKNSTSYYRLKPANTNTIVLTGVANVKSIRLYGNGSGSSRTVTIVPTVISGSGSTFSISSMGMSNSSSTIVEYTTGDLTAKSGYNSSTYYTYTITFPGNCDIWGIYVEAGATGTCTGTYSFHWGVTKGSEDQVDCFTYETGTTDTYYSSLWTIPDNDVWTYVGWQGGWHDDNAKSSNLQLKDMYYGLDNTRQIGTQSAGTMRGAQGYLRIYGNSASSNKYIGFIPAGYVFRWGTDEGGWTSYAFTPDDPDDISEDEYNTDLQTWTSSNAGHYTYVGLKTESGYTWTNRSEARRPVFLKPTSAWDKDGARFFIYYWQSGTTNNGWSAQMHDEDGDGIYEAWIPNTHAFNYIKIGRFPSTGDIKWGNEWNSTGDLMLLSDKNVFEISAASGTGSWALYNKKGKFHIWTTYNANNWYCSFWPHHVLSYDANGGSGAPATQSIACNADPCQLTVSTTEPTRNGYRFVGWNPDESYADAGTKDSDWDGGDTHAMTADVTLYAVWECVDPTITTDLSEDEVDYNVGASATALTVAATAAGGSVSYQWYSNDEKNTTTPTTLTTGASYTPSTAAAGTTYYYCVVTNSTAGCSTTTTSSIAKIVVSRQDPTTQTFSAASTSICSGSDATFTLASSQVGATYYLTKANGGGSAIGDSKAGTGSALTFTATSATTGDYYCWTSQTTAFNAMKVSKSKVTISYKTATSVTVDDATLDDAVVDEEYTISGITGAGAGTLYYQWYSYSDDEGSAEAEIDGAESDSYTFTPAAAGDYYFKCKVTGDCGSVTSDMITVTATVACTDPSASFDNESYTIGGSSLDLSTLWSSNNTTDDVTFSITSGTGTIAADGYSFSSSTAGSVTITASQTSTGDYCDAEETATITVSNPTYTVTYNKNGATSGTAPSDGSSPYSSGSTVTVKDTTGCKFVYSGHVFRGWNTANDGSGDYYAPGDKFTISGNTTLYAVWVEGTKGTVTYNLKTNSSSTSLDNCTSATPTSGDLTASTTINTYGTAGACSSNSSSSGKTQKLNIDASYTAANYYEWTCAIASGKTFTPSQVIIPFWGVTKAVSYKVILTDGTTEYSTTFDNSTDGKLETLTWNIANGAAFAASSTMRLKIWAYKKNKDATAFRLGASIVINGVVVANPCTDVAAPTALSSSAQTINSLTFTWTKAPNASTYTATLYSDAGCTSEVASQDLGDVDNVTFSTLSVGTTYYCKVQSHGNGTTYCADGGTTDAVRASTKNQYTISYNKGSGAGISGSQDDQTKTEGVSFTLPGVVFTRTGYTQTGWAKTDGGSKAYELGGSYTTDAAQTFYPVWTINQYNVSHSLSNVTATSGATGSNAATYGTNYTAEFEADDDYTLPDDITVTIGGAGTTHYTWNASTGALTIDGAYILGNIVVTIVGESEACTSQTVSKVVVTGSSAGTTSGYNEKEYVGTPVISVSGKTPDATDIDGDSEDETGYKMSSDGNSIVFATLAKGTFQEGDVVKIGITRRNDTRVISSNKNVLTIYYGTNKDDADSLTTISTGSTTTSGASLHEGAGFYTYTLTAADVTKIGSKKGIGLFRASSNGENPYVYSVEIIGCRDWTTCTAPTAVAAGSVTGTSATFTITDAENTLDYELYISTSSTSPTAETSATATSSEKTKTVTGLSGTTTYYYWVRSNCGGFKSDWTAGTPATFTTGTAYTVTYNGNGSTGGSVPTDATGYAEGDVVTVKTNSGSLVKSGYTFVGWSTNATSSSGIFYPAGYKFTMGAGNVTLYAVWASGGASAYYYGSVSITAGALTPGSTGGHKGFFTNEGGTVATSSDISLSSTPSEAGLYYESSTLTHTELSKSSNWNPSSSSKRTIRAFKFANNTSYTLALGSATATKITFYGKCGSESRILSVGGVEWTSNSTKETFDHHEFTKVGNFTGNITIGSIDASSDNRGDFYGILVVTMADGGSSGYTVTFDKNGQGSYSNSISNVPSGSRIGVPIPAPTAAGFEFGGWYNEAGCSSAWIFATGTITADKTLYAKWTDCAPSISADPSGATYDKDESATALSVTALGSDLEYQWYSNEVNSTEDGAEITGATSASYTPNTSLIGTTYYYCMVSNDCGIATSAVAAITVRDEKEDPTAVWIIAEPTHGGKGFSFSVTAYKHDESTAWDGTLTTAMLSASEDVVLSGVTVSDNTISGTYGVKASATSPVSFFLELPSTDDCAAATLEQERTFTACSGTGGDGETYKVPMKSSYESKATGKPDYRCENEYGYISPELGTSSVSLASEGYDDFDYYINSGRSSVLIATKVDAVKKIQIYLNANSGAAQVTGVYAAGSYSTALKDYTAMTEKTDYTVSYTDEEGNTSIAKGKNGYIELAFTANLDEGTLIYVVLKKAAKYYGAKLTVGSGSGATVTTTLEWSNSQASGATVVKGEDDADFTITATRSDAAAQASMGEIRYLSSDTKVATVNAVTGQVTIADGIDFGGESSKTTTITAMLLNSGCYKGAKITYTLQVNKSECTDAAGTIEITEDNGCEGVVMTVSGYEEGASIVWYKDGSAIPAVTGTTYTATTSGSYTVVTTKTCARTSNSIVVEMETASASKIVDSWYVKNGRRTPDIALVQTTGATSFTVKSGETTIWDEANSNTTGFGGCDFELKEDGIIYLHGTKPNGDAPSDLVAGNETITVTVSGCGGALDGLDIIIKKQAETLKPSVAFVVDGTTRAKGGTATSVSTAKTSERPLWTYLSSSFTLTGCNIYWSVDSKELREYYSQYDAIVVTDDPNTQTTGAGGVEYVKAFGTLVDVRPILTMEAYVGRYTDGGWHVYNATPTSPNPRQVEMKLECKNHEIFAGVSEASDNVRAVTINGDDYWYITIVDTTQSPYKGTEKDYEALPALQGFNPNAFSEMLGIGTINDDKLQAGVERQQEPAARMMILGIQNNAMGALTNEGKLIIKNAISYLLKTNMEEVDDCSNYFTGATSTDWTEPTNWSKNSVPDFATKVRILAPVVIEDGQKVRASQVDIVVDGTSSKKDGKLNGNVTINPGGALVVGGTVNRAFAPHYGIDDLEPTTSEDLIVQADADHNAALILDNSSGLTGATVQMYSSSYWELVGTKKKKYWSYVAVPIQEALIPDYFFGAFTYYYEEKSGWDKKWDGDYLYPFQAIGLSRDAAGTEHFWGPLVSTESRDIKLTKTATGGGENLIANSWTAPIQIANFDADDFGDANATIYIYNTGKAGAENEGVVTADTENQGVATAGQWLGIPIGVAKLPEYTGLKVIPAMQTFEVDMPDVADYGSETTLHLDYDRLVRGVDITEDNLTEKLHAPKRRMSKNDGDVEAVMKVRVAGVHTLAEVWLIQDGAFNDGFDNGWEAYYAACDDRSPQLYAHSENGNMGIIAKPELEGTILGFAPSRDGADYTFSFYYRGDEELYLNDLLTETSTLIDNEMTYAFTSSDKGNGSRFIISRSPYQSPLITTGTEEVSVDGKNRAKKILYNDKIYILYNGVIYDAMGKVINRK